MSSQDGRQVDGCGRLPGRRATLAGCRVALQGQRASSWEQEGSRGAPAGCLFKKRGWLPVRSQAVRTVCVPTPSACSFASYGNNEVALLVLDASKTHPRMFLWYVHIRFLNTGSYHMVSNRPFPLTDLSWPTFMETHLYVTYFL